VYGCEDWDLWLRLTRRWPVAVVDEELTLYRKHPDNTAWGRVLESALAVVDKWYSDPATAPHAGISRRTARARQLWVNASALATEDRAAALRLAGRALTESPAAALGRSALATVAGLVLPRPAVELFKRP